MQDGQLITVPNRVRTGGTAPGGLPTVTDEASYAAIPAGAQFRHPDGSIRTKGGAAPAGTPPFGDGQRVTPPQRLRHGAMTSGRRTEEGNRLVGGVPNSGHLRGTDADYDGPDLNALLAEIREQPGHRKSFIHDGHVHASGDWDVPYFGHRGTTGLRRR
jgi:hypothetical protein